MSISSDLCHKKMFLESLNIPLTVKSFADMWYIWIEIKQHCFWYVAALEYENLQKLIVSGLVPQDVYLPKVNEVNRLLFSISL